MLRLKPHAALILVGLMAWLLTGCGLGAAPAIGWTYLNVAARTGGHAIIAGLRPSPGHLDLIVSQGVTACLGVEAFRPLLLGYNLFTGAMVGPSPSPYSLPQTLVDGAPATLVALSFLSFGKPPVCVTGGEQPQEIAPFPGGVTAYYSGINPATQPWCAARPVSGLGWP
ncbi:MAG: hypothetical protein ACP5QO_01230 [Clostridia bacterium]